MVIHLATIDCLVENQDINLASNGVVICDRTRNNGEFNRPEGGWKTRYIHLPSSVMDEEAAVAENSVVGMGVEVHHGL